MPFTQNDPNINRNGRPPKGTAWSEILRAAAQEIDQETGKMFIELAAEALVKKAISGDVTAMKEIGDRIDGKVVATQKPGSDTLPIPILSGISFVDFSSDDKV